MNADRPIVPDTFEDRLGRFLLVAFGRGVDVEGTRRMAGDDPVIADLTATVTRTDAGPTVGEPTADDPDFADAFEDFLLSEFAEGVDVEGTWQVRFSRPAIPNWDVEIEFSDVGRGPGVSGR